MPDGPDKPRCHELRVLATNGRVFLLTVADVDRLFLSRIFVLSLTVYCIVLGLVDPQVFGVYVGVAMRCFFWCVSALVLVAFLSLIFRIFAWLYTTRGWRRATPTALILLLATACTQVVYELVGTRIFGLSDIWGGSVLSEFLRYGFVVVAFEVLLSTFIYPAEFAEISRRNLAQAEERGRAAHGGDTPAAAEPEMEAKPDPETKPGVRIEIAGQSFDLCKLHYLKSVEHYVEFVGVHGTKTIRAALKDVVKQVEECDGIQPHRSYWVGREAIAGMAKESGNAFLVLKDGTEIPISRQRRRDVTDWLGKHVA